jgi:hypothetical protein
MDAGEIRGEEWLEPLAIRRFRVTLALARPLAVPAHRRGVLWRGAFAQVFRGLVCHDVTLDCAACGLAAACPYTAIFAPGARPGRPPIARLREPPRPFVFADPCPAEAALPAGRSPGLGLTIIGSAAPLLPYFVVSLRRLGEAGLGRAGARFEVERVAALDAAGAAAGEVYVKGGAEVRLAGRSLQACDLRRPEDAGARRVRVRFVTPTDLRGGEAAGDGAPAFGVLFRRARDRLGARASFYGEGPVGGDPRAVAALADTVETQRAAVRRVALERTSARTGERHPVSGLVGEVAYEGAALAPLMPWLRLAELVHVGKHATFGNGRIAVEVGG